MVVWGLTNCRFAAGRNKVGFLCGYILLSFLFIKTFVSLRVLPVRQAHRPERSRRSGEKSYPLNFSLTKNLKLSTKNFFRNPR
jgi:hypothetical protein